MAQRTYLLKLFQVTRTNTDSFTVQADNEDQAIKQGMQIAKNMGLPEDYDFEVEDLTTASSAGAAEPQAPTEPGPTTPPPPARTEPEQQPEAVSAAPEPEVR